MTDSPISTALPFSAPPSALDVELAYFVILGRRPESIQAVRSWLEVPWEQVVRGLLSSDEYRSNVVRPVLYGGQMPHLQLSSRPTAEQSEWATSRLGAGETAARNWAALHAHLIGMSLFVGPTPSWSAAFLAELSEIQRRGRFEVVGSLEMIEPDLAVGWAVNCENVEEDTPLELHLNGKFLRAVTRDRFRRDLQDRFGGHGRFGFSLPVHIAEDWLRGRPGQITLVDRLSLRVLASAILEPDHFKGVDTLQSLKTELSAIKALLEGVERRLPMLNRIGSFSLDAYDAYRRMYFAHLQAVDRVAADPPAHGFPCFCVILVIRGGNLVRLINTLESVRDQDWENWRLVIYNDDPSAAHDVDRLIRDIGEPLASRACVRHNPQPSAKSLSIATAIESCEDCDFYAFLGPEDRLEPDALTQLARTIHNNPGAKIIYSDEDRVTERLTGPFYFDPVFKPSFDKFLLLQHDYIANFLAVERNLCLGLIPLQTRVDELVSYELILKASSVVAESEIVHIPRAIYHRDGEREVSASPERRAIIEEGLQKLVAESLRTAYPDLQFEVDAHHDMLSFSRPLCTRIRRDMSGVRAKVVIASRDRYELLKPCIDSLLATRRSNKSVFDLCIVDNGTTEPEARRYLEDLRASNVASVMERPGPFNWAALNNDGAVGDSDVLIFLNNDTLALTPDWCDELCMWALQPDVGAVGSRLLFEDGTIQHAGMVLTADGAVEHDGIGAPGSDGGYLGRYHLVHQCVAVTGACLATSRKWFNELNGFDSGRFPVSYNDVDFCFRASRQGLRIIYTPHATFYHLEGRSRGFDTSPSNLERADGERRVFLNRWGTWRTEDPFYNPNFFRGAKPFSRLAIP